MPEDTPEQTIDEDDDSTTSSTQTRWEWTGTILALATGFVFLAVIVGGALGVFTLSSIPQAWFVVLSLIVLMAFTWTFGKETLEAVQKARGK